MGILEDIGDYAKLSRHAMKMYDDGLARFYDLKIEADQILSTVDKLRFWSEHKAEYLRSLTLVDMASSGHTGQRIPNVDELFFDRLVTTEINHLEYCSKFETPLTNETLPRLSWAEQTEQAQLIYVLAKSNRIQSSGKPISQKELTTVFETLFGTQGIKVNDLVNKSLQKNKVELDGQTFINELNQLLLKYKEDIDRKKRD